jgi:F-type H+-transporting ATPase subunit b
MHLIWSQIVTHIIGFIIAVLILKRFAWGPILKLLDERREKIRGEFERIETEKRNAAALKAEYEMQLRTIEAQARARIQEAVQEGQKVAAEIREHARQDAHAQLVRAREEAELERDKASVGLRDEMADMVVRATERLIRERLDDQKHRQLVTDFIASIDTVDSGAGSGS